MSQQRGLEISQRVEALELRLRERSESDWAERLNTAVAGGATGTEILVRIAVVLRDLARSDAAKRIGCANEARELERLVGRQLRI